MRRGFHVDPVEPISSLCAHGPPEIDLLYPFVTHDHVGANRAAFAVKFGNRMVTAMEFWMAHPRFADIRIRVFEDALQATISKRPKTDWFGPRNISYLVVETSGNYDLLDQLKVIGSESGPYRNIHGNVREHPLSDALAMATQLLERRVAAPFRPIAPDANGPTSALEATFRRGIR